MNKSELAQEIYMASWDYCNNLIDVGGLIITELEKYDVADLKDMLAEIKAGATSPQKTYNHARTKRFIAAGKKPAAR